MVRCRNFQKTLVIEIIPSPSIKDKLIANFHRLFYIWYRPFESNLSAANPNLQHLKCQVPQSDSDEFGDYLVLMGAIMREEMVINWLNRCIELL